MPKEPLLSCFSDSAWFCCEILKESVPGWFHRRRPPDFTTFGRAWKVPSSEPASGCRVQGTVLPRCQLLFGLFLASDPGLGECLGIIQIKELGRVSVKQVNVHKRFTLLSLKSHHSGSKGIKKRSPWKGGGACDMRFSEETTAHLKGWFQG